MKKIIVITAMIATTSVSANWLNHNYNDRYNNWNGANNWAPFDISSNLSLFKSSNNWLNNTDFGVNFNTKNKTGSTASGAASGNATGRADAYAKGYADGQNSFYNNNRNTLPPLPPEAK